jgi:hypothetical protein
VSVTLPADHPTSVAFLDETGAIASDRVFAVGCLKVAEPADLIRPLQKLKDRKHRYEEIHWVDATRESMGFYEAVIDIVRSVPGVRFSCFVADRAVADPVARFGSPWRAYERLAAQLLIGSIQPGELVCVLADEYSTPDEVRFEQEVRDIVNQRLDRLAVTSVCRLDSRAAMPLQIVDLLTAAVAFEFRQNLGLAGTTSPKALLAKYVRDAYAVPSFLNGIDRTGVNVKIYRGRTRVAGTS